MNDESREARLTELTNAYLEHLETGTPTPDLSGLPEDERGDAEAHIRVVQSLWGADNHDVPALDEDPVAIRFGFDRVVPTLRISGLRIREARQAAGLTASALAAELTARGYAIARGEFGAIERSSSRVVPVELASALAAVLATSIANLEAPRQRTLSTRMSADEFTSNPLFMTTVSEWAQTRGLDAPGVAARQRDRLLQLRHRGSQELTADEWTQLLLDLLRTQEL